jgi:hypothetical protein
MTLVKAADASEIPVGEMKAVNAQGKEILLANVGGTYYAIGNRCTFMCGGMGLGELAHSQNEYLVIGEGGPTGGLLTMEKSFISILDNISRVGR